MTATVAATSNRFEVKYLVPVGAMPALTAAIHAFTVPDPHVEGDRGYRTCSVYWDSPSLTFFWEKIEGLKYRRKVRLRRYGDAPQVFLEIKQRTDRTVQKRRIALPLGAEGGVDGVLAATWEGLQAPDPVSAEVLVLQRQYLLEPKLAVAYRRTAFFAIFEPELRVTFDTRVQYSATALDIARPFETGKYVLDPRTAVMEIKFNHLVPLWLTKLVARHSLRMIRMSKYCSAVDREWFRGQLT